MQAVVCNINTILKQMSLVPRIPSVYTISVRSYDINWREQNRLPLNPTSHGPLTNQPDYTFLDGRPTPLGSRQKQRILKQREIARTIITLSKEIDFAKERYEQNLKEKDEIRQKQIENKLKPKGHLLLKK